MPCPKKRVLFAWIGHSDFRALAAESPSAVQQEIMQRVKGELPSTGEWGPIRTLLEQETFDQTVLLSTYPLALTQRYTAWLNRSVQTVFVTLPNPTDYPAIFQAADVQLRKIREQPDARDIEICLHLSPGTPGEIWRHPSMDPRLRAVTVAQRPLRQSDMARGMMGARKFCV